MNNRLSLLSRSSSFLEYVSSFGVLIVQVLRSNVLEEELALHYRNMYTFYEQDRL